MQHAGRVLPAVAGSGGILIFRNAENANKSLLRLIDKSEPPGLRLPLRKLEQINIDKSMYNTYNLTTFNIRRDVMGLFNKNSTNGAVSER